jgi:hypothetical protein
MSGTPDRQEPESTGSDPDDDFSIPDLYPRIVDRADYDPDYDPAAPVTCDVCGNAMRYTAQCKLVCPVCGYMRDCSDP